MSATTTAPASVPSRDRATRSCHAPVALPRPAFVTLQVTVTVSPGRAAAGAATAEATRLRLCSSTTPEVRVLLAWSARSHTSSCASVCTITRRAPATPAGRSAVSEPV